MGKQLFDQITQANGLDMEFPLPVMRAARQHPFPLLFATISGAHLYGFPSPDSDYDLRGVHILSPEKVCGLDIANETIQISQVEDKVELDLVTHDVKKFFKLMLKKNGYVLEQLYSPLIVQTCSEHDELKVIAKDCITRHHSHHYLGFAKTQWRLFSQAATPRVKPLLYVYRVLLTGIHLMRTGLIEANLSVLNEEFKLAYLKELIDRKLNAAEKQTIDDVDVAFHQSEYERLRSVLEISSLESELPEVPSAKPALNELLLRLRLSASESQGC